MNNMLPPYFNMLKPNMPLVCDYYGVRNPKIHLPTIRHDFAKQLVQYQGSCLTFSLAGQSGQPKSGLAGPQ